ncbi:TIGR04452 family lipoprotein [Leptospira sp. FAT2]|uniref:TIGR04452 family lipoprotein n=1 Tax=Leptospira sanjuanensis TaxID=2879643 RepID=UPI001EE7AD7B|nr:TIGR04452 family lipoprotein [Leptospira sanjuanensis]MCG6169072.1 TIGR04452 family lipoprotein [Leptospira sanjuanensis]MCG6194472.1 TIGR04452 family lipoprotein [Leptospira sanjuanensis]
MKNVVVLFLLIVAFSFSCSTVYDVTGRDSIKAPEAALKIDEAVLIGMVMTIGTTTSSTSSRSSSGSILSLAFISSTAGIDEEDTSALYEKKKVKDCADSILSTIILVRNTDAGLIAASACKLKKLP